MIKMLNANVEAEVEAAMEILGTDPPLSRIFKHSMKHLIITDRCV